MSKMAELLAKVSELREKTFGALEDVPENLIGTIITLLLLTALGLGFLLVLGYWITR